MAPLLLVLLASFITLVPVGAEGNWKRQKREWIIAPRRLKENHDYTGLEYIARIRSDKETDRKIYYSLTGPGVDLPPEGVFRVDQNTGFVRIYSVLDREKVGIYELKGIAKYSDGSKAEKDIDLKIVVEDENDCVPVIQTKQVGYVNESSAAGTVVMTVIATDADENNTANSQIHYSIVETSNIVGMFSINAQTGQVTVRKNTLDREKQDTYKLIIRATDLNGAVRGNTGTGEIEIRILDINDNRPTLEKESYEGRVEENTVNVEVMRIQAVDMDMIHTDNWLAVYEIVSGNEGGYFTITTDSKTNEGVIMINKALDYEELKELNLEVAVSNKASYNFGSQGSMTGASISKNYPVKINVVNQKEGPRFQPAVKVVTISEDKTSVTLNQIITNYAAIDSDTLKTATNVRYAKIKDDDNWLIIDGNTGDIRLNKLPDRESKFLINGTYYAKIICISNETPSKTATGTIAIQVEDFNDHCPELTATAQTMCLEDSVIYITAVDKDEFPNSAPFEFTVIEGSSSGKWTVEPFNKTTAILRDKADLWPGKYKVAVEVQDQQGKSCADVQIIDLTVCTCTENTKSCVSRSTKSAGFGASGVLLLLLGLLLLLLVPLLLLFCLCGGAAAIGDFKPIPFETKQQLISYHTEGQGEDRDVPLLQIPAEIGGGKINIGNINNVGGKGEFLEMNVGGAAGAGGHSVMINNVMSNNTHLDMYSGTMGMGIMGAGHVVTDQGYGNSWHRSGMFDGMALSEQYLGEYYLSKSNHAAQQSQQKDALLVYDYEGQDSEAGSVGCCSLLEDENDLSFLDDLGPKFKTLAQICQGSTLVTKSVDAGFAFCPPRPVSPVRPSTSTSTHTHYHTHRETVKDRDHVSVSALNTSNVASGSSTFVQEERMTSTVGGLATVSKTHLQDTAVIPSQTLLIQQPAMYYAATPMYVVEPKPQVVFVAGGTQQAVGQVDQLGLSQGLVQIGGLTGSQGVVLAERQVGAAGATGQVIQGLPQGTISRSRQVLVVENGSSGGEQVAQIAQSFSQTGHRSTQQGLEVRGQGVGAFSLSSTGLSEDVALTATPKLQGSQRVVVQRKKVSVTERNIESSSRA